MGGQHISMSIRTKNRNNFLLKIKLILILFLVWLFLFNNNYSGDHNLAVIFCLSVRWSNEIVNFKILQNIEQQSKAMFNVDIY